MKEGRGIRRSLIAPLKDKERTMKINYVLGNNYVIAAVIVVIDLALFFIGNYVVNVLRNLPAYLFRPDKTGEAVKEFAGAANLIPQSISVTGVIVTVVILAVVDGIMVYRMKTAFGEKNFNVGQKGVERFTTTEEIKGQYKKVEELKTPYSGKAGIPVSRIGDSLYIDDTVVNNIIIGITRSGKGEMFAKSSIETYSRAEEKPSLIINDMKLEHYKVFKGILKKRGYLVCLLNGSNPLLSMGFNPVSLVMDFWRKKDYDTAEMVANSFAHAYFDVDHATGEMRYFVSAASDLCVAMILASVADAFQAEELYNQERLEKWKMQGEEERLKRPFEYKAKYEKNVNLYSMIVNFGEMVLQPVDKYGQRTMLDVFFERRPKNDRAKLKFLSTRVAPGKTKSGVFSEMLRELSMFTLQNVARMTAESTLDLREIGFGEKPIAVFLATPSYDSSLYKIPTVFIRQLYYVLGKACDEGVGKCPRRVIHVLDEAGNMPPIEMLETEITMGLGQNISFDFYLQNYEQLTDKYGRETAETIKGNCGNHIYILTESEDTAKEFSNKLGQKSVIDVQRAGGKLSTDKYFTETIQERPLLYPNQLLNLQEGECVVYRNMKRRNLKGNKIKPYPIFNSVENGRCMKYAYEYFTDEFPDPNQVNFYDVCSESREHIDPEDIIWNIDQSFRMLQGTQIKVTRLEELDYEKIREILTNVLGKRFSQEYGITGKTTAAELLDLIGKIEKLSPVEKQTLTAIIMEEAA